jgi:hypothetical protein
MIRKLQPKYESPINPSIEFIKLKIRIAEKFGNQENTLVLYKKYKCLNIVPKPVNLETNMYDLVDENEFRIPDGRTPLLIVTQFGIFPKKGIYQGKPENDYSKLEGLENQNVGFIGKGYLSHRERRGIIELFLDTTILNLIRSNIISIDLSLWSRT